MSNRRQCLDFCYWEITTDSHAEHVAITGYSATNVADPHQATFVSTINTTSSWRCALDVAGDDAVCESKLSPPGYFGTEFPYLQCARGAGEILEANADLIVESGKTWWTLTIVGFALVLLQFLQLFLSIRSRRVRNAGPRDTSTSHSYEPVRHVLSLEDRGNTRASNTGSRTQDGHVVGDNGEEPIEREFEDETITDDDEGLSLDASNHICQRRRCRRFFFYIAVNIGVVAILTISIASLIDVRGNRLMSGGAMRLTPKCYNPSTECAAGNSNIDRVSEKRDYLTPFSYVVASDAQLNWYDGESPDIGRLAIPQACSDADTCSSCTAKIGVYANELMRKSMEMLINMPGFDQSIRPLKPKTLVLNGDLTQYFHPHERSEYEHIYHTISGLKHFFPALGNHEIEHGSGATYGSDQWAGSSYCNSRHALGYIRSGLCGNIPNFDPSRIVRYDSSSLAYSWEEGRYHFVHTHYYPSFESAGLHLKSSIAWLERDVSLAYQANLTTILFVHASQGLNDVMQRVLLGKNVAAIFAGHSHRCLMRKCVAPVVVYENQIGNSTENATSASSSSNILPSDSYDKCLPGTTGVCGGDAGNGGMSLYYLRNKSDDFVPPSTDLFYEPYIRGDRKMCPAPKQIAIVNNTLLCRRAVLADSEFPPRQLHHDKGNIESKREHIPIFWSGSASFQTFLKVDFYEARFTVNAMTAAEGMEGKRYIDMHSVPSVVYPYHEQEDLDEVTVIL